MGYDPQSNELKALDEVQAEEWKRTKPLFLFSQGEQVQVKGVIFDVHHIGPDRIVLKPVRAAGMPPHQQRVMAELKELTEKREKLGLFIGSNPTFGTLPIEEQDRLRRQFELMVAYEGVLQERIDHFAPQPVG